MTQYTLTPEAVDRLTEYAARKGFTPEDMLNELVFRYCKRRPGRPALYDDVAKKERKKQPLRPRLSQLVNDGGPTLLTHEEAAKKYGIPLSVFKRRLKEFKTGDDLFAPYP